jgi:hypothetical protein
LLIKLSKRLKALKNPTWGTAPRPRKMIQTEKQAESLQQAELRPDYSFQK